VVTAALPSGEASDGGNLVAVPLTYYDRDSDIAYFEISATDVERSEELAWGLLDVAAAVNVVGAEYWHASHRLPRALLEALPAPPAVAQRR